MGTLYIVSTPIGNLDDISVRALKTLLTVDIILCEDTRRTGNLLNELKKRYTQFLGNGQHKEPKYISYYDEIEDKRLPEVIQLLNNDSSIALVSDNGTPAISDPGFRLIREVHKRNIPVTAVPGPTAAVTALVLSGLPTNSFLFLGFLPEKQGARIKILEQASRSLSDLSATLITYCAPHKLEQTLQDMMQVFGDISVVVARELTKIHEEVISARISEHLTHITDVKGECVILLHL